MEFNFRLSTKPLEITEFSRCKTRHDSKHRNNSEVEKKRARLGSGRVKNSEKPAQASLGFAPPQLSRRFLVRSILLTEWQEQARRN